MSVVVSVVCVLLYLMQVLHLKYIELASFDELSALTCLRDLALTVREMMFMLIFLKGAGRVHRPRSDLGCRPPPPPPPRCRSGPGRGWSWRGLR